MGHSIHHTAFSTGPHPPSSQTQKPKKYLRLRGFEGHEWKTQWIKYVTVKKNSEFWKGLGLHSFFCKVTLAYAWYALLVDCLHPFVKTAQFDYFHLMPSAIMHWWEKLHGLQPSLCRSHEKASLSSSVIHYFSIDTHVNGSFIFNLHLSRKEVFQCLTKLYPS